MKKVLNFGSLLLILTLLLNACGKDPEMESQTRDTDTGSFSLSLGTMGEFEVVTKAGDDVNVNDFNVRIHGESLRGAIYDSIWMKYSDMPSVVSIPAGNYTISACNGEMKSGFNTPYYFGEKSFQVGIQEMTDGVHPSVQE